MANTVEITGTVRRQDGKLYLEREALQARNRELERERAAVDKIAERIEETES